MTLLKINFFTVKNVLRLQLKIDAKSRLDFFFFFWVLKSLITYLF